MLGRRSSKPVAITAMRMVPVIESSMVAPKITFASSNAELVIIFAASFTSFIVISGPPVMVNKIPLAPSMESSKSGLDTAALAASAALFSPEPIPIPIKAEPASRIIVFTSAKSTFIKPGIVINSAMPWTPWRKTSSTILKDSNNVVFLSIICKIRSLGMVIIASTLRANCSHDFSAISLLCGPSKANGFVTTATVKAPASFAAAATTGAAPEPVPPPKPQVIKTISASFIVSLISFWLSSAAFLPISGSMPAPKPRVTLFPICNFCGAEL